MALTLAHFRTLDNIEVVPLAYLIGDVHEFLKRPVLLFSPAVLMSFKSPAGDAVGVIENAVEVGMFLVDMASHKILILAFEKLLTYLLTDLQSSLRQNLPRLETDNEVLCKNIAFPRSAFPDLLKVMVSLFGIGAAPVRDDQPAVICLFRIGDIFQRCKLIN